MKANKELTSIMTVSIFSLILGVIGPSVLGFALGGFDSQDVLNQFQLYTPYLIAGSIVALLAVVLEIMITKSDKKYGNSLFFNSPGDGPSLNLFKNYSNFQLFMIFTLIFSILGFVVPLLTSQTTFTGVGTLGQQFTETGNLIYSSALIPIAENLGIGAVAIAMVVFLRFLARKYDWSSGLFWALASLSTIAIWGALGVANHLLRYSSSNIALVSVGIFWTLCGILTVTTGSFIPAWVLHIMNNLFYAMKVIFSSDVAVISLGAGLVAMFILYFYLYRKDGAWWKGIKQVKGR